MPHPLRRSSHVDHPQSAVARHQSDAALGATSPTPHQSTPNTTGSRTTSTTSSPPYAITSIKPGQTSSHSHPSPPGYGPRSGPTTPMNASTAKSADAPTPWESSPTAKQSSAWSEPSSPNKTTNGPKADATSASTSSPNHDSHHNPPNRRTPHSNSAHNPTRRTQNDYTTPQDLTVTTRVPSVISTRKWCIWDAAELTAAADTVG